MVAVAQIVRAEPLPSSVKRKSSAHLSLVESIAGDRLVSLRSVMLQRESGKNSYLNQLRDTHTAEPCIVFTDLADDGQNKRIPLTIGDHGEYLIGEENGKKLLEQDELRKRFMSIPEINRCLASEFPECDNPQAISDKCRTKHISTVTDKDGNENTTFAYFPIKDPKRRKKVEMYIVKSGHEYLFTEADGKYILEQERIKRKNYIRLVELSKRTGVPESTLKLKAKDETVHAVHYEGGIYFPKAFEAELERSAEWPTNVVSFRKALQNAGISISTASKSIVTREGVQYFRYSEAILFRLYTHVSNRLFFSEEDASSIISREQELKKWWNEERFCKAMGHGLDRLGHSLDPSRRIIVETLCRGVALEVRYIVTRSGQLAVHPEDAQKAAELMQLMANEPGFYSLLAPHVDKQAEWTHLTEIKYTDRGGKQRIYDYCHVALHFWKTTYEKFRRNAMVFSTDNADVLLFYVGLMRGWPSANALFVELYTKVKDDEKLSDKEKAMLWIARFCYMVSEHSERKAERWYKLLDIGESSTLLEEKFYGLEEHEPEGLHGYYASRPIDVSDAVKCRNIFEDRDFDWKMKKRR